jgi:aerobic carbon-monoxide dehydrogenase medium subunit
VQGSFATIAPFRLHRPRSLNEVLALIAAHGTGATLMAGGVDLVQMMKSGAKVSDLVYLKDVPELKVIETRGETLRIGACVTHYQLETDPVIQRTLPQLAELWRDVANVRVRMAGTVGGNLMARNRDYDLLPVMLALNGRIVFAGNDGRDEVSASDFAGGRYDRKGLLAAIEIPIVAQRALLFDRTLKPAVSVAAAIESSDGKVNAVRAGIGCAYESAAGGSLAVAPGLPIRELASKLPKLVEQFAASLPEPTTDVFASAEYRRRMITVLLARQLSRLTAQ